MDTRSELTSTAFDPITWQSRPKSTIPSSGSKTYNSSVDRPLTAGAIPAKKRRKRPSDFSYRTPVNEVPGPIYRPKLGKTSTSIDSKGVSISKKLQYPDIKERHSVPGPGSYGQDIIPRFRPKAWEKVKKRKRKRKANAKKKLKI